MQLRARRPDDLAHEGRVRHPRRHRGGACRAAGGDLLTVPARLSFATIGARDVGALRAFYSELWPETTAAPDGSFVAYHLGGAVLAIYDLDRLGADSGGAFDGRGGFELAVNVDRREQVDEVLAEVAALRVHVEAAADAEWGGRTGHFRDPEGNRWEVAWNPAVRFDDGGAVIAFE